MVPPIRKGDGTSLAPKGFAEVRKGDGTILWSGDAIPDSAMTQYDASKLTGFNDGDSISEWPDEIGGNDMTGGNPEYKTDTLNGNPVVRFDGTDDVLDVDFYMSPPNTIIVVASADESESADIFSGYEDPAHRLFWSESDNAWNMQAGETIEGGSNDGSHTILTGVFDSFDGVLRQDGSEVASGEVGDDVAEGLTLGARYDGDFYLDGDIAELIFYNSRLSSYEIDQEESRLSDKWGISLS